jgi:hypothetical protein
MTQTVQTPVYTLNSDEKTAQVMMYTVNGLYWGDVVVKQVIRVSTWLRTNTAPDRICLYNAKYINTFTSTLAKPTQFRELHVATSQVLAYLLMPPAKEPPDYDPTEPNRRMQPVSILIAGFRMDGCLRLAGQTSLGKFLELARENYTAVYDAKISNPNLPGLGVISVPYLLVRQEVAIFTLA